MKDIREGKAIIVNAQEHPASIIFDIVDGVPVLQYYTEEGYKFFKDDDIITLSGSVLDSINHKAQQVYDEMLDDVLAYTVNRMDHIIKESVDYCIEQCDTTIQTVFDEVHELMKEMLNEDE